MELQIAGIKRSRNYSPNQTTNDALIFLKTAQELIKLGASVNIYAEEDVNIEELKGVTIFSMARGEGSIDKLMRLQESEVTVINPPQSTLNCYRTNMHKILVENSIPFPRSIAVNTKSKEQFSISDLSGKRKIWVKRGDVHAIHREDVTPAYSDEELNFLLKEYSNRGIREALLQEHIEGDVIKFYSVSGTTFFHWYYQNGNNSYKFSEGRLRDLAVAAADKLGIIVYGGDAIIKSDGTIIIIDMNDWPSFAPVRNAASKVIAETVFNQAIEKSYALETSITENKLQG